MKTFVSATAHNIGNFSTGSYENQATPGTRTPENVTIDFALTDSREVYTWFNTVHPKCGNARQYEIKDITLYGYDENFTPLLEIKLEGAYPIRWKLASVGASEEGLLKEEVEFVITNLIKVK